MFVGRKEERLRSFVDCFLSPMELFPVEVRSKSLSHGIPSDSRSRRKRQRFHDANGQGWAWVPRDTLESMLEPDMHAVGWGARQGVVLGVR